MTGKNRLHLMQGIMVSLGKVKAIIAIDLLRYYMAQKMKPRHLVEAV